MNPISPERCLECDVPLAAGVAGGLCPKCLLKLGLASQLGETSIGEADTRRVVVPPQFPFDFGGYRVLRLLGRGGMGAVYEAEQLATGRRVALKVLGQSIDSTEMRKRFLREGRLAAAVNHPNTVYIFGTEEIEGAPVIAMELIAGGTLRDEIKRRGPLPPREAVDVILQVIAGLECAASAGVLHRDVKPENCFITAEKVVKVGDFGLSVSTLARQDTQITASGTMLGTPSYAPPEQLRGDELDVRADIYSAGATLYALITGHAPFRGENVVQVVANVLNTPAPADTLHKGLPTGLADVVLRCLEKDRTRRFADYTELREALLPFSSAVTEPANPGVRFAAGVVDEVVRFIVPILCMIFTGVLEEDLWLSQRTIGSFLLWLGFFVYYVAYFAIPEARWGASVGKALFRLRVIRPDGAAPGLLRATIRATLFVLALQSTTILTALVSTRDEYRAAHAQEIEIVPSWLIPIFIVGLFVTMRRHNGYASVPDLLTGTRVVVRPAASARRTSPSTGATPPADSGSGERIGPFRVIGEDGGFTVAFDDALRRTVWIRRHAPGTPTLAAERRELGRATRLRWLQGFRDGDSAWDAFEAPTGRSLSEMIAQTAPSWAELRHWLLDLAEELDANAKDDTRPARLSLAQVWITASGHAVLLDEPRADTPYPDATGSLVPEQLLLEVANTVERKSMPLHARHVLENFASGAIDRLSFLAGNLRSLVIRSAVMDRKRRTLSIFIPAFALLLLVIMVDVALSEALSFHDRDWSARYPDRPPLSLLLRMYETHANEVSFFLPPWKMSEEVEAAMARHVADRYTADFGGFEAFLGGGRMDLPLSEDERKLVAMLMARFPRPNAEQLAAAEPKLHKAIGEYRHREDRWKWILAPYLFVNLMIFIVLTQAFWILIFGSTPGQRMFGFALVDEHGHLAGRGQLIWRWIVAWFPAGVLWLSLASVVMHGNRSHLLTGVVTTSAMLWLAGVIAALVYPRRGLHDRIAGTWLVPR